MYTNACGTCPLCLHKGAPCGSSAFFCTTVVTHVTPRNVLVTQQVNSMIMRHLSDKSTSFAEKSVPSHLSVD